MGSAQDVLDVLCAQLGCTRYREKAAGRGAASRLIVTFTRTVSVAFRCLKCPSVHVLGFLSEGVQSHFKLDLCYCQSRSY